MPEDASEMVAEHNPWRLDLVEVERIRAGVEETVAEEKALDFVQEILAKRQKEWEEATQAKPEPQISEWDIQVALNGNEFGDADLAVKIFRGRYLHDNTVATTYSWAGTHWAEDANRQVEADLREVAGIYSKHAKDCHQKAKEAKAKGEDVEEELLKSKQKACNTRANKLLERKRTQTVYKLATAGAGSLGVSGNEWEQEPTLLACSNGVLELSTGRLIPGRPEQRLRTASPFEFHGLHAPAPTWDDALLKALRMDMEMLDFFERVVGYCSTGLLSFKDFYCAYGPGGDNGKSIIFDALRLALGGYGGTIPTSVILEDWGKSKTGPNPELLKLRGLRCCILSEAKRNARFSMETIKLLTGADPICVRALYKDPVEFMPTSKFVLHTNYIPRAHGNDPAFHKRLRILPFKARFVVPGRGVDADPEHHIYEAMPSDKLRKILHAEGPGILAWICRCAKRFLTTMDLTPPDQVVLAGKDYQEDQDYIGQWITECCDLSDHEHREQAKDLYGSFCKWLKEEKDYEKPSEFISSRVFGEDLQTRFERIRSNKVYYKGVKILDDWWPREGGKPPMF